MNEHLWQIGAEEKPLRELPEWCIRAYIRTFQAEFPTWNAFRRRWVVEFENELIRRKMTPEVVEICHTSFLLDEIIKKKEEEQYSKPVVGWKGFNLVEATVEKEISRIDNKVIIERSTGLRISGAKDVWDSHRQEAYCLDYDKKNDKTRKEALNHIRSIDQYGCKCGLYCYFDKRKCVAEHEFEVVAKVTGWGTIAWAHDGARCSDMRIEHVYLVKKVFLRKNRFDWGFIDRYIDLDKMARDLADMYDNEFEVSVVEHIGDIPEE